MATHTQASAANIALYLADFGTAEAESVIAPRLAVDTSLMYFASKPVL